MASTDAPPPPPHIQALLNVEKFVSQSPSVQVTIAQQWENTESLHRALEDLMKIQKDPSYLSTPPSTEFSSFESWLEKENFPSSSVKIGKTEAAGNGLYATKDIKKDDLIVQVPERFMLTNISPKDSAVAALKPSPMHAQAQRYLINMTRQYLYLRLKLSTMDMFKNSDFTYREFRWAISVVMTRQNRVPVAIDGEGDITWGYGLIPFWDMANHTPEGEITTFFNSQSKSTECHAVRDFKEGEEVYIYYGNRTSSEFLLHSGFIPPPRTNDSLVIPLGISQADPLFNQKNTLLAAIGLKPSAGWPLVTQSRLDGRLMSFLRVMCMNSSQLDEVAKMESWMLSVALTQADKPITKENDLALCTFLDQRCKLLLSQYKPIE
eukprot:Ihof_evm1s1063 gene=Ihof_evmTU1s1063